MKSRLEKQAPYRALVESEKERLPADCYDLQRQFVAERGRIHDQGFVAELCSQPQAYSRYARRQGSLFHVEIVQVDGVVPEEVRFAAPQQLPVVQPEFVAKPLPRQPQKQPAPRQSPSL